MQIIIREGAEAEAAAAAVTAEIETAKAQLRAAGACSFEGAYIDAEGVARSIDVDGPAHD